METLKIAFFCWESLHSVRIGGLAAAATNLAEKLGKKHEVHYFTLGSEKEEEINGVFYHRCNSSGSNIVEYCKNMGLSMANDYLQEEKKGEFDVLHFHDWHPTEALHILQDRPTVLTLHSTEYGRNGNSFGEWWEFKEISGKEWYASLKAKKVTTVSHTLKNEVMWLYNVPDWKVGVIPNGICPEKFYMDVEPEEVKKDYGLKPSSPLVLFMGRVVYQKGPDLLLDAIPDIVRRWQDTKFFFTGEGGMRSYLDNKARRLNAVRFLGYIPDREFIRLLNASDLVAIPSRNEPFGLVLLEAWSAKRCVVGSDVGGLSENIDNFENGVKVYPTSDSIKWGVDYVMGDNCKEKMGRKGREKVGREFRWQNIAHRMVEAYKCL